MTTYATKNPLGSVDPRDLYDNSQNFDSAINDLTSPVWQDRFGKSRHTWYGLESMAKAAIAAYGYIPMDSFQAGATLTLPNQALRDTSTGEYYRWDGTFPPEGKVVPAGSTPASAGGTGAGKWLSVGDAVLRGQLANPDIGDALMAVKAPFANTIARTQHELNAERVSVKNWGAKGDGVTDDTAAIITACADLQTAFSADGIRRTLVFEGGKYMTSEMLVCHENMAVHCDSRVVFQNITADKTFPCWELRGLRYRTVFGVIDAYGAGIRVIGNVHDVNFHTISNCIDGIVLRADSAMLGGRSLDNVVNGVQIGLCTNGIVFEQNANGQVQQGNEVRVNFISETPNAALFRTYGGFTHTAQSNWDSNKIVLQAYDPVRLANAAAVRNATSFAVPNLNFSVESWCGGWTPDAGTICLIRGIFSVSNFLFSLATRVGLNELVDAAGKSAFGSCAVSFWRNGNLGSATSFYQAVAPGASFNGGVALVLQKFRIRVTIPDLAAGQTFGSSFWHVVTQVSGTSRVRLEQYSDFARGKYLIELRDAGSEQQGMVRLWVTNIKSTTITGGDVDLIVSVS